MGIFYNAIRAQILLICLTSLGALLLCSDKTKQLECPNVNGSLIQFIVSITNHIDPAII